MTLAGNITAQGTDSMGIFAQSTGGKGGGDMSISIASGGMVQGGSGSGVGVRMADGANNTLVNRGTISSLSGMAITATGGNDTIQNYGTISGSVDLGAGRNAFDNYLGATLNLGTMGLLNLGAGNRS